jgi:hypothetical protein
MKHVMNYSLLACLESELDGGLEKAKFIWADLNKVICYLNPTGKQQGYWFPSPAGQASHVLWSNESKILNLDF